MEWMRDYLLYYAIAIPLYTPFFQQSKKSGVLGVVTGMQ